MTSLTAAQRPQGINSIERHLAYDLLLLARLNPDLKVIEQSGTTTRVVEAVIAPAADGSIRLIGRVSLPLDPDYANDLTQPLYMQVLDVSNVTVPDDWKQAGT
jgi:hypothetical protein